MKKLFTILALISILAVAQTPPPHFVTLNWTASTGTNVTGYNVYKFVGACSPTVTFTKLTATPQTGLTFTDTAVTPGSTYCYTVTALAGTNESQNAGMVQAIIPTFTPNPNPPPPTLASSLIQ